MWSLVYFGGHLVIEHFLSTTEEQEEINLSLGGGTIP